MRYIKYLHPTHRLRWATTFGARSFQPDWMRDLVYFCVQKNTVVVQQMMCNNERPILFLHHIYIFNNQHTMMNIQYSAFT